MKNIKRYLLTAGILYQSVTSFAQTTASFAINGLPVSSQSALQCFTNNPLVLDDQSQGNIALCTISITDATFTNVLYSTGTFSVNNGIGEVNIYNWCNTINSSSCTALPFGTAGTFGVVEITSSGPNDPNPSTYKGLITLSQPVSNPAIANFTVNNNTLNSQTPVIFNGPQTLLVQDNSQGTIAYSRVEVWDATQSNELYSTGNMSGPLSAQFNLLNMCNGSQNASCTSLNTQSYGTFYVKLIETSTAFPDPNQSSYGGFIEITPAIQQCANPPQAGFKINGTNVSSQSPTPFYNCNGVTLNNTSTGQASLIKMDILDPSLQIVEYSTGFVPASQSIDLLNACTNNQNNCSSLSSASGGIYGVRLTVVPDYSYDQVYASSSTALIQLIPSIPSQSTSIVTTTLNTSNAVVQYNVANGSVTNPDQVGRSTAVIHMAPPLTNQVYISGYTVSLSKYDPVSQTWGQVLWTRNYVNGTLSYPCNSYLLAYAVALSSIGSDNFFSSTTNAPDGSIWGIDISATNSCGTVSLSREVVQINDNQYN